MHGTMNVKFLSHFKFSLLPPLPMLLTVMGLQKMGSLVMGRAHLHTTKVEYLRTGGNEGERRAI